MSQIITFEKSYPKKRCHGWILYTSGDSSLNPHYIDLYRNACEKRGMSIELGLFHPALFYERYSRTVKDLFKSPKPQYVINRTRDYHLAEYLESQGICVFNNSLLTQLGNDKSEAYRYMNQHGIPTMPTQYNIETPPQWYPAIVKSCDGHGGTEVFFIRNEAEWKAWNQNEPEKTLAQDETAQEKSCRDIQKKKQYIIQQAASDLGKDVRVYVVGNQITAAVQRISETDFRSNYSLGGSIALYELSDKERELAERAIAGLSVGMAGIDFIFHNGETVFNEIEDMVGARGLYSLTDYDIVDGYMSYIQEELQHVRSSTDKTADM